MLISPESKYPYCRQCRLRDWRHKRRALRAQAKRERESAGEERHSDAEEEEDGGDDEIRKQSNSTKRLSIKIPALKNRLSKPIKPRPPTPYPEYKNLAALLNNFRVLAKTFFDAQTMHFAYHKPTPDTLSIFIFDGEFTTVAPDYDVFNRKETNQMVMDIAREIQAVASLQIGPKKFMPVSNHGAVTRFACKREPQLVTFVVPDRTGNSSRKKIVKARSYHRVMDGELEVAVFADKSHPFIPGERTVVRVRLVG